MPARRTTAPASQHSGRAHLEGVLRASTRVSIIATDTEGIIQTFNSGAERMLGYTAEEVIGKLTPTAIHLPEEMDAYGRELSNRLGRKVEGFEVFVALARLGGPEAHDTRRWTYVRKDGTHVPVDLAVTAIYGDDTYGPGEIEGFLGVAVDLSERVKLQSRLNRALISVDNAADMLFWVSVDDRRIDFVNKAAMTTLGYSRRELIGKDVSLVNPARDEAAWKAATAMLRDQGRCVMEAKYRKKDGSLFPVEITASLVRHKGREFIVGIVRDVTDRKALQSELTRAMASVENTRDMVFWTSLDDRRFHYVNRAACDTLGYDRDEFLGMRVDQLNPARGETSWQDAVAQLHSKGNYVFVGHYRHKNGSFIPVETVVSPIEHEGKRYALAIARDISARKALEANLLRAQTLVDSASDLLFWIGVDDRRISFVNQACTRVLGYARDEFMGMNVGRLNPLRTLESWKKLVERVRTQGSVTYEVNLLTKDGAGVPFEISASQAWHEGAEHIQVIGRDISERRRMQAKADRQLRVSNALAELARALVNPSATQEGAARLLLDRARELTGSPHGLVGSIATPDGAMDILCASEMMPGQAPPQFRKSFSPVDKDQYPGLWGHSLTTRKGFYENNPEGHPSARGVPAGHTPILRLLAVPVLLPASGGPRAIGQIALANAPVNYTAEDLAAVQSLADLYALGSEQLRIRAELTKARDEAEAASRAKSDFLANITHEVRTPLNGILGMLQLLDTTPLDADQADYLSVALISSGKLSTQLDNVLEFARLDAAGETECVQFPPTDLLHSLKAQFSPAAQAKGLSFETQAAPGLPELVYTDPQALRQALAHLLDNAIKFTETGGVRLVALPERSGGREFLVFRVEDTGIGVQEHMKNRIFAAFVQADATSTRRYGGTGLGLAIADKLATRLGGSVRVEDNPGGGTVMILTARLDCVPPSRL